MSGRWAVICGVVRNEQAMLDKLETLKAWKKAGEIDDVVFSTWIGEIEKYPTVEAAFARGEFKLVELQAPLLKTVGHTIHQSKTLYYGLQAVPDSALVLKLRPDIAPIAPHILPSIKSANLTIADDTDLPRVFGSKILVPMGFIDSPFYLNDITFYGHKADLLKIANFDLSSEIIGSSLAPEQFFFRGPFAGLFPTIEAFLSIYPSFAFDSPELARRRIDALLSSDFYLDVLATYLRILDHYFLIGFGGRDTASNRSVSPEVTADALLRGEAAGAGLSFHAGAGSSLVESEAAVRRLINGDYSPSPLGDRLKLAVARADGYKVEDAPINPLQPSAPMRELQDKLEAIFPGRSHRLDTLADPNGRRFRVTGHQDRVDLMVQSDQVAHMAHEINQMRRAIDELRANQKKSSSDRAVQA